MPKIYMTNRLFALFLVPTLFVFTGCGDPSVSGTVTFSDGTPLSMGTVCFEKEGENFVGYGELRSNGVYSMGKARDGEGLPPGDYLVYVRGAIRQEMGPTGPYSIPLISEKYTSPTSSGLACQVKGKTVFNFQVSKPGDE